MLLRNKIYDFFEKIVDFSILPSIVVLFFVIIIELFFHEIAHHYHSELLIIDYCIIGLFTVDLFFKYMRVRDIKKFLRTNWLDILAIFPFFLIFRVVEPILFLFSEFQKEAKTAQLIFHESLEISKSTTKIVKEAESVGKISRSRTIIAIFRSLGRSPRFLKAVAFFEHPTGKHHLTKDPLQNFK
jgi:hypothetical protein